MSRQGEAQSRTTENVKDFWNKEADEWGDNPQVTIRDHYFRLLELNTICALIAGRDKLLDIGCGTGFSTLFYAQGVNDAIGADYASKMVQRAERLLQDPEFFRQTMAQYAPDGAPKLKGNVRFEEGNVLAITYPDCSFDAVVAERVLINLPQQQLQDDAVAEVARVVKPGGTWVSVEVSQQGHQSVDRARALFGLPAIEKYWHNLYVEEDHYVETARRSGLTLKQILRFETFQFLTKVVHPLVVAPAEPRFLVGFNDAARKVGSQFPTYASVMSYGLEKFLRGPFRELLAEADAEKLEAYDRVVPRLVTTAADFSTCSHQVLFHFEKQPA